jgi:hypothetical protein
MIQAISTTPLEDIKSYFFETIWGERKNKNIEFVLELTRQYYGK